MTVHLSSPDGLLHPTPYDHVAIGHGTRQVHVAGQTARGDDGGVLADDLEGQTREALRKVATALRGAEASFADVVRFTFYVPDWGADKIDPLTDGINGVAEELGIPQPWPPMTLIGVAALWMPDLLVEIEAFAILD